jgi:hypothetical protein
MLGKLSTHDVESITTLFTLADKCARATEGRAWHSPAQAGATQMGGSGSTVLGSDKKKKKKCSGEKPLSDAPVAAAGLGARMRMASAHSNRVATEGRALFIPLAATMPQNVVRSRSSRSAFVSDVSIPLRRAHRNAADLAWRRPTKAMLPQARESLGIILPSKS